MNTDEFRQTLLAAFNGEAAELLEQIDLALQQAWSADTAHELFRHFHSLKGTAGLLEFSNTADAASTAETLARSGFDWVAAELQQIHQYLAQSATQIRNGQGEAEPYNSTSAEKLIAKITASEATAKQEQRALFQLFTKHLIAFDSQDTHVQRGSLKTLIRAAELMELNELSEQLQTLSSATLQAANKSMQQHLLDTLIEHERFGSEFINFYRKANP